MAAISKKNFRAFYILVLLFFMWGFITCLNDILIPYLKAAFDLTYTQAMLIQFCFFGGRSRFFFLVLKTNLFCSKTSNLASRDDFVSSSIVLPSSSTKPVSSSLIFDLLSNSSITAAFKFSLMLLAEMFSAIWGNAS